MNRLPLTASAPGKLMLCGEYAVLDGGSALAVAAGRRARVCVQPAENRTWALETDSAQTPQLFRLDANGQPVWLQPPVPQGAMLEAAFRVLTQKGNALTHLAPLRLKMYSRDLQIAADPANYLKIGIGSSAAIAVALSAALQSVLGQVPAEGFAQAVHAEFQQQRGSGMDVSTSFRGGVVSRSLASGTRQQHWPEGLELLPVWTGVAAATPPMLERFAAFRLRSSYVPAMTELKNAAAGVLDAWEGGSIQMLLDAFSVFAAALRSFDEAAGIGVWSPPHQRLAQLAAACGLVYKPSGAGGGDLGIALGTDARALQHFAAQSQASGYMPLELKLGGSGLWVETPQGDAPAAKAN